MSNTGVNQLPSYNNPPVIEVVCGAQFNPIKNFQAIHYGKLHQQFIDEYPDSDQQAPLAHLIETYQEHDSGEHSVQLAQSLPLPRVFFVHKTPNWLIQVQPDRFLHNWRITKENNIYPRFPEVFNKYLTAWEKFVGFCADENLDTPTVNQLELTYINHVIQGEGWSGLDAPDEVFPDLSWRDEHTFLGTPESIAWKTSFIMPDESGRLHVSIRHALRLEDKKNVLLCELTTRGMPKTTDSEAINDWFQLGREWIVRGFSELASEEIQEKIWRRTI